MTPVLGARNQGSHFEISVVIETLCVSSKMGQETRGGIIINIHLVREITDPRSP